MTDANTITTLRQQRDEARAECDRLRDRLAAYERDLIDKDTGKDRSRDADWLRAGFLQRGAEIERLEEIIENYQHATILRTESVPKWAWWWTKTLDTGPFWVGFDPVDDTELKDRPAFDFRPDHPGPITLPIVDVE